MGLTQSSTLDAQYLGQLIDEACQFTSNNPDMAKLGGGYKTGGYTIGGFSDLTEEYDTTVSSKAKRDLIRKLSDGISRALKVSPPSSSASNDEMVAHLLKIVPNPRKGKSIIANKEKQAKLCADVADVINKNYGNVIDKSLGPDGVCNQVSDIVESLSAGLNQEYVTVAASVQRALQNLLELKDMLERSYGKLYDEVQSSTDSGLKMKTEGIEAVHKLILDEVNRQIAILSNLTNTNLKSVSRDLAQLLAENRDFKGLVSSIKYSLGTSEWGDKLGFWLSGVNNVAQMANTVNKALKAIGMKVSDYKKQEKLSDLTLKTHELMEKLPANKLTREAVERFEKAVELLKRHHGHHAEISKHLKSGGYWGGDDTDGGYWSTTGGAYSVTQSETVPQNVGGAQTEGPDGTSHEEKHDGVDVQGGYDGGYIKLDKKLKQQSQTRRLMLKDFKSKAKVLMDRVYNSVFSLGKSIGDGRIRLSDDLHRFKVILGDMTVIFREGIEYALTGYYRHANAVEHKERFLGLLRAMLHVLEPLKGQSEQFREVASNAEAMIKLVDFYNDKFKVHVGHAVRDRGSVSGSGAYGGEFGGASFIQKAKNTANAIADAAKTEAKKQLAAAVENTTGAYDGSYEGGAEFKAAVTLRNARNSFDHFYNIAKFKSNLNQVAGEMKLYNKDYTTVVGAAIGKEVDKCREEYNQLKLSLDPGPAAGTGIGLSMTQVQTGNVVNIGGSVTSDYAYTEDTMVNRRDYTRDHIMRVQETFLNAKIKLYKVAQAIDEYLQKFTDETAANPDDVREVAKMLSSVQIMANWFNNKSGDAIASLYEMFPWSLRGFRAYHNNNLQTAVLGANLNNPVTRIGESSHYYAVIGDHIRGAPLPTHTHADAVGTGFSYIPGNPFLPISPARAIQAHRFAKYTVEKVFSLKNIVSAFTYLGDKFGGKNIHKEVFMSPNDMYKALLEYMYVSALTMGWGATHMQFYGCSNGTAPQQLHNMNYTHWAGTVAASQHDASSSRHWHAAAGNVWRAGGTGNGPLNDGNATMLSTFRLGAIHSAWWCCSLESDTGYGALGTTAAERFTTATGTLFNQTSQPNTPEDFTNNVDFAGGAAGSSLAHAASQLKHAANVRHNFAVAMSGIADHDNADSPQRTSLSGWKNIFDKEDKIFINCIKAMAAKIFTVTGLYNMLNFADTRNYALNPTRLILGGGRGGGKQGGDSFTYQTPKIHEGAMELYARLPLLAEFYRDIFCFEEACNDDLEDSRDSSRTGTQLLISMVPEVGSMWAGFIQCVFDQPSNTNGIYTENAIKRIIHEINEVYLTYKSKSPKDVVITVIKDFVAEINSRYGLMTRAEITQYRNEELSQRNRYTYGNEDNPDPDDFDILDTDEMGSGVAPSDRYSKIREYTRNQDFEVTPAIYRALRVFRRRIDNRIQRITHQDPANFALRQGIPDFGALIMSARDSLKTVEDPEEQLKIVARMMTGMDSRTQNNREAHIMFHEAVITPLATLSAVTNALQNYEQSVREWDAYSLYKGLEKTFNPRDYRTGAVGSAWGLWAAQKWQIPPPAAGATWSTVITGANFRDASAGTIGTILDYAEIGMHGSECRTEMYKQMDVPIDADRRSIAHTIAHNLWRNPQDTFPAGAMGVGPQRTFNSFLNDVELTWPLHWEQNRIAGARYGLVGGTAALPPATLRAFNENGLGYTDTNDDQYGMHRHVAYAHIRWEALFKQMVSLVYGLTNDLGKMCEFSFANKRLTLNHTKLQVVCEEIMATIRKDIDKFRGIIDDRTIRRYENNTIPGSINWLQEHLIDGLFGDKQKRGLKRAHGIVTKNFQMLANVHPDRQDWSLTYFGLNNLMVAGANGTPVNYSGHGEPGRNVRRFGWGVEEVFAELTHYNSRTMSERELNGTDITSPPHRGYDAAGSPGAAPVEPIMNFSNPGSLKPVWTHHDAYEFLMKDSNQRSGQGQPLRMYSNHLFKARHDFHLQNSAGGQSDAGFRGDSYIKTTDRNSRIMHNAEGGIEQNANVKSDVGEGLMMKFNEVMGAYVRQFWDVGSSKIYAPLIDMPANGPFNQEVFKAQGWPDLTAPILSGARDQDAASGVWSNVRTRLDGAAPYGPLVPGGSGPAGTFIQGWVDEMLRKQRAGAADWFAPGNYDQPDGGYRSTGQNATCNAWTLAMPGGTFAQGMGTNIGMSGWQGRMSRYVTAARDYQIRLTQSIGHDGVEGAAGTMRNATFWAKTVHNPDLGSKYGYTVDTNVAVGTITNADLVLPIDLSCMTPAGPWGGAGTGAWASAGSNWGTAAGGGAAGQPWIRLGEATDMWGAVNAQVNNVSAQANWQAAGTNGDKLPATVASNVAAWITGLRYINKLKRAILHKSRELDKFIVGTLRRFVYNYITKILGDQVYTGEVYRLETIINLQEGNDPAGEYPLEGTFTNKELMRQVYGSLIDRNAKYLKAYVLEQWLLPFANTLFGVFATEAQMPGGTGNQQAHTVNIADIVAITSALCTPSCEAIAQTHLNIFALVGKSAMGTASLPVNPAAGVGAGNHLGLMRGFYSSGGTHYLGDIYRLMAGGTVGYIGRGVAPNNIAAAVNEPYNTLYRNLVEFSDEFEGRNTMGEIWNTWNSWGGGGNSNNINTGAANANNDIHVFMLAAGNATFDVMSKLLGVGVSNFYPAAAGTAVREAQLVGWGQQAGGTSIRSILPCSLDIMDLSSIWRWNGAGAVNNLHTSGGGILWSLCSGDVGSLNGVTAAAPDQTQQQKLLYAVVSGAGDPYSRLPPALSSEQGLAAINDGNGNIQEMARFYNHIGDPKEILFASTAKALRTALSETGRNNVKSNIIQSIAEIPLRMKEGLKAQLPIFQELFGMMGKKADLLKGIMKLGIGLDRPNGRNTWGRMEERDVHGSVYPHRTFSNREGHEYYVSLLDKISTGCGAMVSVASSVLNELNDAPLYLEVAENSITDYKNANGNIPFMPLSSMAITLQWPERQGSGKAYELPDNTRTAQLRLPARDPLLGYPVEGPGSDLFTFNYGTRLTLHSYSTNPMIEHLPGMAELLQLYNVSAHGQKKMEPKTFGAYVGKIVTLLRYASSTRLYSGLFGADRRVVDSAIYVDMTRATVGHIQAVLNPPLQATTPLSDVMALTVSSDKDSRMADMVSFVLGSRPNTAPISRSSSMIYNILDLNISPINVHAMRKEIPLANLYNYAYTFDSFVSELVESSVTVPGDLNANSTTHDVLAILLKHPYVVLSDEQYYKHFANIIRGRSSLDLYGHPRFITDQIWNKVLFGEFDTSTNASPQEMRRRRDAIQQPGGTNYNNIWHGVGNDQEQLLHYLRSSRGQTVSESVDLKPNGSPGAASAKGYLAELGRLRFDTKFCRNLVFLANVQRIMTHKIDNELSKMNLPVVSNAAVTNRKITDFHDRETHSDLHID